MKRWLTYLRDRSHEERIAIFVTFLLLSVVLLTAGVKVFHMFDVPRYHAIKVCPEMPIEAVSAGSLVYPVLTGAVDLVSGQPIALEQFSSSPQATRSADGLLIEQCWFLAVEDKSYADDAFAFTFATGIPETLPAVVTIGETVDDTALPRVRKTIELADAANGELRITSVTFPGYIRDMWGWVDIVGRVGLLLLIAAVVAMLLNHFWQRHGRSYTLLFAALSFLSVFLIAWGLVDQLLPLLNSFYRVQPPGHRTWLVLVEIWLLLTMVLLPVLAYRRNIFHRLSVHLQTFNKAQVSGSLIYSLLFGSLVTLATLPYAANFHYHLGLHLGIVLGVLFLMAALSGIRSRTVPDDDAPPHWTRAVLYALPFLLICLFYWLVFWPGLMFTDTAYQIAQVNTGIYNTHHPIVHTLLLGLLTRIWPSQGSIVLLQTLLYAAVMGIFSWRLEVHRIPRWLVWGVIALLVIYPGTGIMATTVIKGGLHGIFLIAAYMLLLEIYFSDGAWLERWQHCALLAAVVVGSAYFRHNGLLELAPTLAVAGLFFRKYWRRLLVVFASVLLVYFGSIALIKSVLVVDRGFGGFIIQTQFIYRSYIHQGRVLDEEARAFLHEFPAVTLRDIYTTYHSVRSSENEAKQKLYDYQRYNLLFVPLARTPVVAARLAGDVLDDPLPMLNHIYYSSKVMWVPATTNINSDRMARPTSYNNLYLMQNTIAEIPELQVMESKFPAIFQWIGEWTDQNNLLQELLWRPGLYSLLMLFTVGFVFIREKFNARVLWLWLPGLIHLGVFVIFHLWNYSYRYHWGTIAVILIFTAQLLIHPGTQNAPQRQNGETTDES